MFGSLTAVEVGVFANLLLLAFNFGIVMTKLGQLRKDMNGYRSTLETHVGGAAARSLEVEKRITSTETGLEAHLREAGKSSAS